MSSSFEEDVGSFAEAGWSGMEVWLTKLEKHLESHSIAETQKLVADHQLLMAAASYQGGLLLSQGEQRKAHYDHYRRRLDICQSLDIKTLLVVADFVEALDELSLQRAIVSLAQAAQWAQGYNVRLALEFRGRSTFCASLDTALALIHQCGESNVGVNLDVFHYYIGPSKYEDFAYLTRENLAFVQLCDLSGAARELAGDSDRVLPGDGDFQLKPIVDHLQTIGYEGWLSLELMNPVLWESNAQQVAELGLKSMNRLAGEGRT